MKKRLLAALASSAACALSLMPIAQASAQPSLTGFPAPAQAPQGAPNVFIILTDDVGYAAASTFGGAIPTPTFDTLAQNGLSYNNFHSTALCSPTRAALLTGRNHHAVNFGNVADLARGEPGYTSIIPKDAPTIAQILSGAGYNTAMFGKHHNTPTWENGPLGPFEQWPTGMGFQYFYGFNAGHTDQFAPDLVENTNRIEPPKQADYILDRDLADRAIDWVRLSKAQNPDKPFFLYYAPGTAHTPLHAPQEWIEKFRGKFDAGWDVYREETLRRQKRLGIVPKNTQLAPMPADVKPWDSLTSDEKRVQARYMEAYAGALAYADYQIGRVIDHLRTTGQLDNTLVVYIQGDNGAEGTGLFNYNSLNGRTPEEDQAHALANIDAIGGPQSYSGISKPWAIALNTPFPYHKAVASRLGGITNGVVVSWPDKIRGRGVRNQFTDISDVLPTVLEAAQIAVPESINGQKPKPFDGISFAYSFEQKNAPAQRQTKYFEMMGRSAIYHNGWLAAQPVLSAAPAMDAQAPWQLYDLTKDFAQTTDIAQQNPAKLAELQALYQREAARNNVPSQVKSTIEAIIPQARPETASYAGQHVYHPSDFRYSEGTFPSINNRSWKITANLEITEDGNEGVIVTQGGRFSGWGLVVLDGKPTFYYRETDGDEALFRLQAPEALTLGDHTVEVRFDYNGPGIALGGNHTLLIDGKEVASKAIARTVAFKFSPEVAAIGFDTGTPLTDEYTLPFAFKGKLGAVTFFLDPMILPPPRPRH